MASINLLLALHSFFLDDLDLWSQTECSRKDCQQRIAAAFDLRGEEELSNWWKPDWSDNQRWQCSEWPAYPVACRGSEELLRGACPDLKSEDGYNEQK